MADPPMDRVVALGAKIAELRKQLAAHEAELAALLRKGQGAHDARAVVRGKTTSATPEAGRGTTARIVRLLAAHPRDVFDAAEVAEHLDANVASVRVMLKRLVEAGKVRRTGRGAYRAR